jgi:hypothetical protein
MAAHSRVVARFGGSPGIRGDRDSGIPGVNGYRLRFEDAETYSFLIGLYEAGMLRFTELDSWLRKHAAGGDARS